MPFLISPYTSEDNEVGDKQASLLETERFRSLILPGRNKVSDDHSCLLSRPSIRQSLKSQPDGSDSCFALILSHWVGVISATSTWKFNWLISGLKSTGSIFPSSEIFKSTFISKNRTTFWGALNGK